MENASLLERLNEKLGRIALLLFPLCVLCSSFAPVMDNVDLGWHVAQGRWIVQHFSFYRHDVFSYANFGHSVVDEYPLFQLILYAAWSMGWLGPCLLTAVCYGVLSCLVIAAAPKREPPLLTVYLLSLGLAFFCLFTGALLRPHVATYLGIVILGLFLLRNRKADSWVTFWPMALLQVAWTNCHSGFVIGPAMVGLFGAEMTLRRALQERDIPWATARTWLGGFLLVFLACFVNPDGIERFRPVFLQEHLESIRAYVGEMEPLPGNGGNIFGGLTIIIAVFVLISRRGKGVAWSLVILAALFYWEALSVRKSWPVYGLFVPLIVLSGKDVGPSRLILGRNVSMMQLVTMNFIITSILALAILTQLLTLRIAWRERDHGRSELPLEATDWMKAHGITGRLFHRCEDGGWLQMNGYDHGETFSDTGFGKYDEAFIHEVGLVNERPALVPHFIAAYRPDFIVCGDFCFQWPFYLRRNGWRPIFYSPNSSVWTRPEARPALPTVTAEEIMTSFDHDFKTHGMPVDVSLFGRNIIALNSLGLEDFAFAKLTGLPKELHHAPWYWEAARLLCFAEPPFSSAQRDALMREAGSLHDGPVSAEFRAYDRFAAGKIDDAQSILRSIAPSHLSNAAAELLLKIELDKKAPEALALARRTDCFDLRNGHHWQYLAEAEEQAGNLEPARIAWKKAVFYYPDDGPLMKAAADFAARHHDVELGKAIAESGQIYGRSQP